MYIGACAAHRRMGNGAAYDPEHVQHHVEYMDRPAARKEVCIAGSIWNCEAVVLAGGATGSR